MYKDYLTLEDFNDLPELEGNSIWENSPQLRLKISIYAAVGRLERGQQFTINPENCSFEDYLTFLSTMGEIAGSRLPDCDVPKRAEAGDAHVQGLYARMLLEEGRSGEAFEWARKAAAQNDPQGIVLLGHMYLYGLGTDVDYNRAAVLLEDGVGNLNAVAMTELSMMYKDGLGVEMDARKAFELVECAAYLDHPMAMRNLSWHYLNGVGTAPDEEKAIEWFRKAEDAQMGE